MLGIFDSGLGGLTVAKAIRERIPQLRLLYLGDTARLPYGNRSPDLVFQFTVQAVGYLLAQGCPLVIVACNTASAVALRRLQQDWLPGTFPDRRVLGVVRPLAEHVAAASRSGRIGVIGTRGTILSGAYVRELQAQRVGLRIFQQACPLVVPLIEEGWGRRPETTRILRHYLQPLKRALVDTLVLGCTHYGLLRQHIAAAMGRRCQVPDPAAVVAEKLADYLRRHPDLDARLTRGGACRWLVTDQTERFAELANQWLGQPLALELVNLEGG